MKSLFLYRVLAIALLWVAACLIPCNAQTTNATVSGQVTDPSGRAVSDATVVLTNLNTNAPYTTKTNDDGIYRFAAVQPGIYRANVMKDGFASIVKGDIELHVQDQVSMNFALHVGSVSETMTVEAGASMINTTDASISTVVDQSYVKNMPLNGRSFQDLILLTPGVVTQTPQNSPFVGGSTGVGQTGEFSVNGQRSEANNFTVDGVSANLGAVAGNTIVTTGGASGSVAGSTALGTTQALVSVDDLQEFRVSSSTYSAEYGRNPGGQFAFETKSGTNQWHGTAYDYLRNDFFDANDWFNNYFRSVQPTLTKPALRQNDFGGTLGGPVRVPRMDRGKDKTFFFVSYEGLRLIQPQAASINPVPDLCFRGQANACASAGESPADPVLQPVLNAFPTPNGQNLGDGWAEYIGSWSNPSSIDSTSVRLDHFVSEKLRLFFRFSDTGSAVSAKGSSVQGFGSTPSNNTRATYTMRTYTGGASSIFNSRLSNEFRLNYSSNVTAFRSFFDAFAGSTPIDLLSTTGLSSAASVEIGLCYDFCIQPSQGQSSGAQRQWNLVDTLSYSIGRHQFKFGADYRRLAPFGIQASPFVDYFYFDSSGVTNNSASSIGQVNGPAYPLYKNFSVFAQDEWKVSPRLTLSLGLRWDVNPPPGVTQGQTPYTIAFNSSDPNTWTLAAPGTALWKTSWYNIAPRLGAAYRLRDKSGWETVFRAGGGVFFDTGQQLGSYGFIGPGFVSQGALNDPNQGNGLAFPQLPQIVPIVNPVAPPYTTKPYGYPTHLQLPYTLQWNGSIEQALGRSQVLTISYVGSHAARLLRMNNIPAPNNPNFDPQSFNPQFGIFDNGLTSDYHSGQMQFRRRLNRGLTALASYTFSHCIDYGSQNYLFGYKRGSCDYDVRHSFSAAFSYDVPNIGRHGFVGAVLQHWGLDDWFTARSGFPVPLLGGGNYLDPATGKLLPSELDIVPNQPLYLYGASCDQAFQGAFLPGGCPGGRAINPAAFTPGTGAGTAPRNIARGFGAWQMNIGVRREFPIYEQLKVQFRAEAFNVFNHPNFGTISSFYCSPDPNNVNFYFPGCNFGQAAQTLSSSLGVESALYAMGGARSMQFAVKLIF
jgi:Carboxypeptidase regulatory-like domain/TonB dependent receptor